MIKIVTAILILCCSWVFSTEAAQPKKILILCSNGGYGHKAAAQSLVSLLGDRYEIKLVFPIEELHIWGIDSGEGLYNVMLQNGWIRSMNLISKHVAPRLFRTRKEKMERIIDDFLAKEKPDLLISLIPFVNCPASEAARKKDIPFLLVTTDNDLRNWVHGLQHVYHPQFKITIGSDLPSTRQLLKKRNLPDGAIETIGLPLRTDFRSDKSLSQLQKEYRIPEGKPVVLLMMGGAGGQTAYDYAKTLVQQELSAHLIICTGKNKKLAKHIKALKLDPSNSITVLGFTDHVADLMALSNLLITKPGPGTLNEAIAMRLPVLLDTTSTPLSWEKVNLSLVKDYGIGSPVRNFNELAPLVRSFLYDVHVKERVQEAYKKVPPNLFHERIEELVDMMCNKGSTHEI